ncbi:MAG: T9SS type A sorting domain-containing protein [Prolixibacteraceae bacterium]|nr:T9SS type A sorting domain-containing protein [Prolixibacteraceae bacterium]
MEHKKLYLSVVLFLVLGLMGLHAQESVNANGGNALGSGGSVSYSVGQVVYTTNSGTTGTVSQGVQQSYEISVVTGFEDIKWMNLNCSVYPNPTTDYLTLKIDALASIRIRNLSYQLFDMKGRLLVSGKLESHETQIVMVNLVPETYLLEVFDQNKIVKSFKIIKRSL